MSTFKGLRRIQATLALFVGLASPGCTHLFYHPTDAMYVKEPAKLDGLRQELQLTSSDGVKIAAWWIPSRTGKPARGTIVQFHGNAQNMTAHFIAVNWLADEGYDLLTFDYRGYGISEGSPSQKGVELDAQTAIRYALARTPLDPSGAAHVTLYGQSLGGAILMHAYPTLTRAERARVRCLIVESSFHSYTAIARDVLSRSWATWLLQPLAYLLVSNLTSPEHVIEQIAPTPLLVVHGDQDPVVPLEFGKRIYELADPPKKLHVIAGGGHLIAGPNGRARAREAIIDWIANPPQNVYLTTPNPLNKVVAISPKR